jgi:hypothetical protein
MWDQDQRNRVLLLCGAVVCLAVFFFAAIAFGMPAEPGFQASILEQPAPIVVFAMVLIAMLVCTVMGTLLAGTVEPDAGFCVACVGLAALSLRGGGMGDVLRAALKSEIYLGMLAELLALYGIVVIAWSMLAGIQRRGWLLSPEHARGISPDAEGSLVDQALPERLLALAFQIAVMTVGMLLLAQSDAKAQVLMAVGVSAFVGALAVYSVFPVRPSIWFWIGPLFVGAAGYLFAYYNPDGLTLGETRGMLGALARPLPLDYASLGPAGALLGYWMSRKWQEASAQADDAPSPKPATR